MANGLTERMTCGSLDTLAIAVLMLLDCPETEPLVAWKTI